MADINKLVASISDKSNTDVSKPIKEFVEKQIKAGKYNDIVELAKVGNYIMQ
jgi:hypothetical protein